MKLEERWEKKSPRARVIYFGEPKMQELPVYDLSSPAPGLISLVVDRHRRLSQVTIHDSHLIALVDNTRRAVQNFPADLKAFFDGGVTASIISTTMRRQPGFTALACLMHDGEGPARALFGLNSLRELVPKKDPEEVEGVLDLIVVDDHELWPELRHNR